MFVNDRAILYTNIDQSSFRIWNIDEALDAYQMCITKAQISVIARSNNGEGIAFGFTADNTMQIVLAESFECIYEMKYEYPLKALLFINDAILAIGLENGEIFTVSLENDYISNHFGIMNGLQNCIAVGRQGLFLVVQCFI